MYAVAFGKPFILDSAGQTFPYFTVVVANSNRRLDGSFVIGWGPGLPQRQPEGTTGESSSLAGSMTDLRFFEFAVSTRGLKIESARRRFKANSAIEHFRGCDREAPR